LRKVLSSVSSHVHNTASPVNQVDLNSTLGATSFLQNCWSDAEEEIANLKSRLAESDRVQEEWKRKYEETERNFKVAAHYNRMKTPMAVSFSELCFISKPTVLVFLARSGPDRGY
jgi:hypothetical protein